jgi:hypothetical protein
LLALARQSFDATAKPDARVGQANADYAVENSIIYLLLIQRAEVTKKLKIVRPVALPYVSGQDLPNLLQPDLAAQNLYGLDENTKVKVDAQTGSVRSVAARACARSPAGRVSGRNIPGVRLDGPPTGAGPKVRAGRTVEPQETPWSWVPWERVFAPDSNQALPLRKRTAEL